MDLKDFVAETLTQIVEGVTQAQSALESKGATINPVIWTDVSKMGVVALDGTQGRVAQMVQFDVALTVTEGTGTKGGIGIFSGAINVGSSGQSKNENVSVSRVQFRVPLALPYKE